MVNGGKWDEMNILHINSYYNGGLFYKNLFDQQIKDGINIKVYVPVPKNRKLLGDDFGGYTLVRPAFYHFERYFFRMKSVHIYSDLIGTVNIKAFDLIHAHTLFTNGYIAYKLKKKYGIPYLVTVRNTDINIFFKKMKFLRPLGINILKEADRISFLSSAYLEKTINTYVPVELKASMIKKSVIIGNGIDPFWLEHQGTVKSYDMEETMHLLAVGNISRNKNIDTTLKALDLLISNGFKVHLHAVGKIKDEELLMQIDNHPNATYHAFMKKEELLNLYKKSHIFVLPSHQETFGNVYPEALSQGLPIIYTLNQGFHKQFEEGSVGYGVDSNSPQDICEKIMKISKDYKKFSERALNGAEKYHWGEIVRLYQKGYEEIIND